MSSRIHRLIHAVATVLVALTLGACALFGFADRRPAASKLSPAFQA